MSQFLATDRPLVSVVIPAYNAERFITRTLESVLAQSYRNLEILVVNDGSTDRTAVIVEALAQRESRIHLFNQPNAGVAAARNLAIRAAQGQFVAVIDADDLWYPDQVAKQVGCFLRSPDMVGLVYSWSIDIDEQDRPLAGIHAAKITGKVYSTLLCHNFLGNASCTMMRRSSLLQVGGYDEGFQAQHVYGCEDWDLYLRIAEKYEFRVVPEFLVGYRKLRHSMSYDYGRMASSHALLLQRAQQRHPQFSGWLYRLSRSSFYLYFGHQASENGADREALQWVIKAAQSDITPWLRIGTYTLALKSWLRLGFQRNKANQPALKPAFQAIPDLRLRPVALKPLQQERLESGETSSFTQQAVLERKLDSPLFQFADQRKRAASWQVGFKVLVGTALHSVLSLLGER